MNKKERLEKALDEGLYKKCRMVREYEEFVYDSNILFFIKFYEVMVPNAKHKYDESMKASTS